MDVLAIGLLFPLLPVFLVPFFLVSAAWIDRRRRSARSRRAASPQRRSDEKGPAA